jgi:hypothetical protein
MLLSHSLAQLFQQIPLDIPSTRLADGVSTTKWKWLTIKH